MPVFIQFLLKKAASRHGSAIQHSKGGLLSTLSDSEVDQSRAHCNGRKAQNWGNHNGSLLRIVDEDQSHIRHIFAAGVGELPVEKGNDPGNDQEDSSCLHV